MPVFRISGVNVLIIVDAIVALVCFRIAISPVILWEKNSMGRRRTCHIYSLFEVTASFPSIFRLKMRSTTAVTIEITETAVTMIRNGVTHSGLFPESSRSRKTRWNAGFTMPTMAVIADRATANAKEGPSPFIFFFTKPMMLFGSPSGTN